ncbi:MAG: hypothetical protein LBG74_07520, partial [Spirochaetaceae bacterium]|nr:hypothetical protein [Spirochaetaceae bacterium]
ADKGASDTGSYEDFGESGGITIYAKKPAYEEYILKQLNGFEYERENFIRDDVLKKAGFQRTATARFRKTTSKEKAASVFHGLAHVLSFSIVPLKPFAEIEYAALPEGTFFPFEQVITTSPYRDAATDVRTCMELEYMLYVELCNGIVIQNWNTKYYTEKNIAKFEKLARSLPDNPPEIQKLKDRFLNQELPRVRAALARFLQTGAARATSWQAFTLQ